MKQFALLLILVQISNLATAQYNIRTLNDIRKELKAAIAKIPGKKHLFLINNELKTSLKDFDTMSISKLKIISTADAIKTYGEKAKKGVIEIVFFEAIVEIQEPDHKINRADDNFNDVLVDEKTLPKPNY